MQLSNKQLILEKLHELIAHNVIGDIQYNYRYIGFKGELSFLEWYQSTHPNDKLFDGGYFLPTQEYKTCYDESSIYFTVSKENPDQYTFLYNQLSSLSLKKHFFIQYDGEKQFTEWEQQDLLKTGIPVYVPNLKVFEYITEDVAFKEIALKEFLDNYQTIENYNPTNRVPKAKKEEWLEKLKDCDEDQLLQLYMQRLIFDGFLGVKVRKASPLILIV